MYGAEPEGSNGAVGPTVVVEFHTPVPLVYDGIEKDADAIVELLVLSGNDEAAETGLLDLLEVEVLFWLKVEVLDWLDKVELEELDEGEGVGPGRAGVVAGWFAQFDCISSLLRTST